MQLQAELLLQDPNSPTRGQTHVPCIERWSLNHWTTREVPPMPLLSCFPHLVERETEEEEEKAETRAWPLTAQTLRPCRLPWEQCQPAQPRSLEKWRARPSNSAGRRLPPSCHPAKEFCVSRLATLPLVAALLSIASCLQQIQMLGCGQWSWDPDLASPPSVPRHGLEQTSDQYPE